MKLTLSKLELYKINQALLSIKSTNKILTYSIIKNKKALSAEVEAIEEARNVSNIEFAEYQSKFRAIADQYALRDDTGNIIPFGNGFRVAEEDKGEEAQAKINNLLEEYKDAIEQNKLDEKELSDLLAETVSIELDTLTFDILPNDIDSNTMEAIFTLIEA